MFERKISIECRHCGKVVLLTLEEADLLCRYNAFGHFLCSMLCVKAEEHAKKGSPTRRKLK